MTQAPRLITIGEAIEALPGKRMQGIAGRSRAAALVKTGHGIPLPANCLIEISLTDRKRHAICLPISVSDGSHRHMLRNANVSRLAKAIEADDNDRLLRSLAASLEVQATLMPLWLEWDIASPAKAALSLYFTFKQPLGGPWLLGWLNKTDSMLTPGLHYKEYRDLLTRFLAKLPASAHVNSIGTMLSRDKPALRLVLSQMPVDLALKYLLHCGATLDDTARAELAWLQSKGRIIGLFLDFTSDGVRLSGLDIITPAGATHDPIVQPLVERFLTRTKVSSTLAALKQWDGVAGRGETSVALALNHLKIGLADGQSAELKAYLSVIRLFRDLGPTAVEVG